MPEEILKSHKGRVLKERDELCGKMAKLRRFGDTGDFIKLPRDEQARLRAQLQAMQGYLDVLNERIRVDFK